MSSSLYLPNSTRIFSIIENISDIQFRFTFLLHRRLLTHRNLEKRICSTGFQSRCAEGSSLFRTRLAVHASFYNSIFSLFFFTLYYICHNLQVCLEDRAVGRLRDRGCSSGSCRGERTETTTAARWTGGRGFVRRWNQDQVR